MKWFKNGGVVRPPEPRVSYSDCVKPENIYIGLEVAEERNTKPKTTLKDGMGRTVPPIPDDNEYMNTFNWAYGAERDPNGKSQHESGSKLDHGKNRLGLVLLAFSRALKEVGEVGTFGANKYTANGWLNVPNGIDRYTDAMLRHLLQEATGEKIDPESQMLHSAQVAWNALARLELQMREYDKTTHHQD
jgi:hypothetical protein